MTTAPTLLFVCNHNAGRSALAAALARHQAGDHARVLSAGLNPADQPNVATIASLAELGIDDSGHVPSQITADLVASVDVVVAMKPDLAIPRIDGVAYENWDLPDPAEWDVEALRPLRDHVAERVSDLLDRMGVAATS